MSEREWRKSSRCASNACVGVRMVHGEVELRDAAGSVLIITSDAWRDLLDRIQSGDLDRAA